MFHCDVVDIKNISLDKAQKFIEVTQMWCIFIFYWNSKRS